jgi:hypothetical protein
VILIVGALTYILFRKDAEKTRVGVFVVVLVFLAVLMIGMVLYERGALGTAGGSGGSAQPATSASPKERETHVAAAPGSTSSEPQPAIKAVLYNLEIVLYNGADVPEVFVNEKRVLPERYSSGIATLHLAAGGYHLRAEYGARTCSASFSAPAKKPVAANCQPK